MINEGELIVTVALLICIIFIYTVYFSLTVGLSQNKK